MTLHRCLVFFLLLGMTPAALADEKPVRIASGVSGHIHPAICVTKKGTVVVIFSQFDFKDLKLTRSTDGGQTWSEPVAFALTARQSIYPGSLTTLEDGRILHAWNVWYPAGKDKSRYVQYSLSADEGQTWSEPKSLPKNPDKQSVIRHPIVELGPEAWLFSLADWTLLYNPKTEEATAFGDKTHGLVPIVRTDKGTLVSGAGLRSIDGGKTWDKVPQPFKELSQNGWRYEMLAMKNGWLLTSEILGPGVGGESIRFVLSKDDGRTWQSDKAVEYYNPGRAIGGRACPKTVELDEKTIGTVFYDVDSKQTGGSGVFFLRTPLNRLEGN
jgi:hypothetical protein